jgi:hypothetical protein
MVVWKWLVSRCTYPEIGLTVPPDEVEVKCGEVKESQIPQGFDLVRYFLGSRCA